MGRKESKNTLRYLAAVRADRYIEQEKLCYWCGVRCHRYRNSEDPTLRHTSFTLDHIVPRGQGGTNDLWNLVGACWGCNDKRNRGIAIIPPVRTAPPLPDLHIPAHMPLGIADLSATRSGFLTVLSRLPGGRWTVQCDCGELDTRRTRTLTIARVEDDCCYTCSRVAAYLSYRLWATEGILIDPQFFYRDALRFTHTHARSAPIPA